MLLAFVNLPDDVVSSRPRSDHLCGERGLEAVVGRAPSGCLRALPLGEVVIGANLVKAKFLIVGPGRREVIFDSSPDGVSEFKLGLYFKLEAFHPKRLKWVVLSRPRSRAVGTQVTLANNHSLESFTPGSEAVRGNWFSILVVGECLGVGLEAGGSLVGIRAGTDL